MNIFKKYKWLIVFFSLFIVLTIGGIALYFGLFYNQNKLSTEKKLIGKEQWNTLNTLLRQSLSKKEWAFEFLKQIASDESDNYADKSKDEIIDKIWGIWKGSSNHSFDWYNSNKNKIINFQKDINNIKFSKQQLDLLNNSFKNNYNQITFDKFTKNYFSTSSFNNDDKLENNINKLINTINNNLQINGLTKESITNHFKKIDSQTCFHLNEKEYSSLLKNKNIFDARKLYINSMHSYYLCLINDFASKNLIKTEYSSSQIENFKTVLINKLLTQESVSKLVPNLFSKVTIDNKTINEVIDEIIKTWKNDLWQNINTKDDLLKKINNQSLLEFASKPIEEIQKITNMYELRILYRKLNFMWNKAKVEKFEFKISSSYNSKQKWRLKEFLIDKVRSQDRLELVATFLNTKLLNKHVSLLDKNVYLENIDVVIDTLNDELKDEGNTKKNIINHYKNDSSLKITINKDVDFLNKDTTFNELGEYFAQSWLIHQENILKDWLSKNPLSSSYQVSQIENKQKPQYRNKFVVYCDFSYNKDKEIVAQDDTKVETTIVCAFIKGDKKVNQQNKIEIEHNFPIFFFKNLNWELSPIKLAYYDKDANSFPLKYLLENEKNARVIAKALVEKLIEDQSFGNELALLNKVVISKQKGGHANGVTNTLDSISAIPNESIRSVQLFISTIISTIKIDTKTNEPYYYGNNKNINYQINLRSSGTFNNPLLNSVYFSVPSLLETWNHEYGHHLSLYNGVTNSASFLEKLKQIFDPNEDNEKFHDFEIIYKFFNKLNPDNNDNFEKNRLNDKAREVLKLYRKYFSRGVVNLYEEIYNNPYNSPIKDIIERVKSIKSSLYKRKGVIKELDEQIENVINQRDVDKDVLKKYHLYYYDKFSLDKDQKVKVFQRVYLLAPISFDLLGNDKKHNLLKINDIFPNAKPIEYNGQTATLTPLTNINKQDANLLCGNRPLSFDGESNYTTYTYLGNYLENLSKIHSLSDFQHFSDVHDKEELDAIEYFFSFQEILARMFSLLSYNFSDVKRNWLNIPSQCLFEKVQKSILWLRPKLDIKNKYNPVKDYILYKAFGMDIIKNQNEVETYSTLFLNKKLTQTNSGYFQENKLPIRHKDSKLNDNNKRNYFIVDSIHSNDPLTQFNIRKVRVFALLNLKLDKNIDFKKIRIQYKNKGKVFSPIIYDYSHRVYTNNLDGYLYELTKSKRASLFNHNDANYFSLVFKLENVNYNNPFYTDSGNQKVLNEIDKKYNLSSKTLIFVDENNNNIYDQNEIKITLVNTI